MPLVNENTKACSGRSIRWSHASSQPLQITLLAGYNVMDNTLYLQCSHFLIDMCSHF